MNDTPTPTPRTDAKMFPAWRWDTHTMEYVPHGIGFPAEDARKLERELTAMTEQRDRLAEALGKAISWGDSASHHILHRQNINWTYLNEAKETLQSLTPNAEL